MRFIFVLPVLGMIFLIPFFLLVDAKADAITLLLNKDKFTPAKKTIVIIPILTANAYKPEGFYDYYSGKCDESCLTTPIDQGIKLKEESSANMVRTLQRAGYDTINDYILDYMLRTDPRYLDRYESVIVLHSEYVTQGLYDAFNSHHNVTYLSPNANFALVSIAKGKMTLISGHDYNNKYNAFEWPYENTIQEYDKECHNWKFIIISNGHQLNCNPERIIHSNFEMLRALRSL